MGSRYYIEGEGRAAGVRDLFAAIAPRYDLINDLQSFGLHRAWKRRMIRLAEVRSGEPALDVCCGTGDITFGLARAGAQVTGLDFSDPMLDVARRRSTRPGKGATAPRFAQGDAQALPYPDRCFDLVTIAYGLRNLPDLDRGLQEMGRVARPGARLLILDFAQPRAALWRAFYFLHLRTVVPLLGRLLCGEADTHAYILESLKRYPGPEEIARRMNAAGWERVECWRLLGGIMTLHRGWRPA